MCRLLSDRGETPAAVVEPTCGIGNFLLAAFEQFTTLTAGVGIDINSTSIATVKHSLQTRSYGKRVQVIQQSFFDVDWVDILRDLPEPILVVGNPPWITNADLGALGSTNLPQKTNFQNHNGLDAITGKSNFDISEWMLIKLLERLAGRNATLAMLCKTAVAPRFLRMHGRTRSASLVLRFTGSTPEHSSTRLSMLACWYAAFHHPTVLEIAAFISDWGMTNPAA